MCLNNILLSLQQTHTSVALGGPDLDLPTFLLKSWVLIHVFDCSEVSVVLLFFFLINNGPLKGNVSILLSCCIINYLASFF